jgi:hypothetical protein
MKPVLVSLLVSYSTKLIYSACEEINREEKEWKGRKNKGTYKHIKKQAK